MDQFTGLNANDRKRAIERLSEFVKGSVEQAKTVEGPFFHLEFDRVFPDDVYRQILSAMPVAADCTSCCVVARWRC